MSEWTPERVMDYLKWSDGVEKLAMDFNAELAAEREQKRELMSELHTANDRLFALVDSKYLVQAYKIRKSCRTGSENS